MNTIPSPSPLRQALGMVPFGIVAFLVAFNPPKTNSALFIEISLLVIVFILCYVVTFRGLRLSKKQKMHIASLTLYHYTDVPAAESIMGTGFPASGIIQGRADIQARQGWITRFIHAGFRPRAYFYAGRPSRAPKMVGHKSHAVIEIPGSELNLSKVHWRLDGAVALEDGCKCTAVARRI